MSTDTSSEACAFCDLISSGQTRHEGKGIYSFEPLNPVAPGHRLFVPGLHATANAAWVGAAMNRAAARAFEQPTHFNLIINMGADASQTIPHLHVHYVPRRPDDGLTLPWTGQAPLARVDR